VQHYEQATVIDPQAGFYQANLSRAYLDLKQFPEALQAADKALQITPTMTGARETLGDIYAAQKDWTNALEAWERIDPQDRPSGLTEKIAQARIQNAP
jgi:tetratricopeptide (TPR) repeat protein